MRYDFDFSTEAAPRGTNSVKWDSCPENVIPMWVAEMDFPAAPGIIKALQECRQKIQLTNNITHLKRKKV